MAAYGADVTSSGSINTTGDGSAAAVTIAGRWVQMLESRAQVEAPRQFGKTSVTGTLGLVNRNSFDGDTVAGTLLAAPISNSTAAAADYVTGYASLGL